jgi:hypothetical protein
MSWRAAWNTLSTRGSTMSANSGARSMPLASGSIAACRFAPASCARHSFGQ